MLWENYFKIIKLKIYVVLKYVGNYVPSHEEKADPKET